jgi:hypothetical protein
MYSDVSPHGLPFVPNLRILGLKVPMGVASHVVSVHPVQNFSPVDVGRTRSGSDMLALTTRVGVRWYVGVTYAHVPCKMPRLAPVAKTFGIPPGL